VRVDYADPETVQSPGLNQRPYFLQLSHSYLWQEVEQRERLAAALQRSKRKFRNDERVDYDLALIEMLTHLSDSGAQMINPNGRIRENQFEFTRRRGIRLS